MCVCALVLMCAHLLTCAHLYIHTCAACMWCMIYMSVYTHHTRSYKLNLVLYQHASTSQDTSNYWLPATTLYKSHELLTTRYYFIQITRDFVFPQQVQALRDQTYINQGIKWAQCVCVKKIEQEYNVTECQSWIYRTNVDSKSRTGATIQNAPRVWRTHIRLYCQFFISFVTMIKVPVPLSDRGGRRGRRMAQHITVSGTTAKITVPKGLRKKVDQTCWSTHDPTLLGQLTIQHF